MTGYAGPYDRLDPERVAAFEARREATERGKPPPWRPGPLRTQGTPPEPPEVSCCRGHYGHEWNCPTLRGAVSRSKAVAGEAGTGTPEVSGTSAGGEAGGLVSCPTCGAYGVSDNASPLGLSPPDAKLAGQRCTCTPAFCRASCVACESHRATTGRGCIATITGYPGAPGKPWVGREGLPPFPAPPGTHYEFDYERGAWLLHGWPTDDGSGTVYEKPEHVDPVQRVGKGGGIPSHPKYQQQVSDALAELAKVDGPPPPDRPRCPTCDSEHPSVREYRCNGGWLECETRCDDGWHGRTPASRVQVAIATVLALVALAGALVAITMVLGLQDAPYP